MTYIKTRNVLLQVIIIPFCMIIGYSVISLGAEIDKLHDGTKVIRQIEVESTPQKGVEGTSQKGVEGTPQKEVPGTRHTKVQRPRQIEVEYTSQKEVERFKKSMLCPKNTCVFNPSLKFGDRSIEGKSKFGYGRDSTVFGQASLIYKNLKTDVEKKFGLYVQNYVPPICLMDLPPLPLFKLCIRMTQVIFFDKQKIEICFSLHIQMLYFWNKNLYTWCMDFTTASVESIRNRVTGIVKNIFEKKIIMHM